MHFPARWMRLLVLLTSIWQVGFLFTVRAAAQSPASKPQPDVLILMDDERLVGHLVGASGTAVTFKSDLLGNVTVDWSKVKELHTQGPYTVLSKDLKLRTHMDTSSIPQGVLEATDKTITVTPSGAAPKTVPVSEADKVLEEATFQEEVEPPHIGFRHGWAGTITAGASLVEATQQSTSFTGAVSLVRAIPVETDFPPRN